MLTSSISLTEARNLSRQAITNIRKWEHLKLLSNYSLTFTRFFTSDFSSRFSFPPFYDNPLILSSNIPLGHRGNLVKLGKAIHLSSFLSNKQMYECIRELQADVTLTSFVSTHLQWKPYCPLGTRPGSVVSYLCCVLPSYSTVLGVSTAEQLLWRANVAMILMTLLIYLVDGI